MAKASVKFRYSTHNTSKTSAEIQEQSVLTLGSLCHPAVNNNCDFFKIIISKLRLELTPSTNITLKYMEDI